MLNESKIAVLRTLAKTAKAIRRGENHELVVAAAEEEMALEERIRELESEQSENQPKL